MRSAEQLAQMGCFSVVAPAGYGKTELITEVSAINRRTLVLTHTHAGVHAIKQRLKKNGVPPHTAVVDTIAGWCTRYARAFPNSSRVHQDTPQTNEEWDQLNQGVDSTIQIAAIRDVVRNSYDQILIDEYQDCVPLQHQLAMTLSDIVPTLIFGDPMQGIFEFAGATMPWDGGIHNAFPLSHELKTPHRWKDSNPELGKWIAEAREKLIHGKAIDLHDPRIIHRQSDDAFDMSVLFDGLDSKQGTVAAIHCHKGQCYRIARASNGGFQAIEENAARTLATFAEDWDSAIDNERRKSILRSLITDCFNTSAPHTDDSDSSEALENIRLSTDDLENPVTVLRVITLCRSVSFWKLFRGQLWRDIERALNELILNRVENMSDAVDKVRQRSNIVGRRLPSRTISTPLLLKGLQFDHVIIPSAGHFLSENNAQAKLFYVAISRAKESLTISSNERYLQFPVPSL